MVEHHLTWPEDTDDAVWVPHGDLNVALHLDAGRLECRVAFREASSDGVVLLLILLEKLQVLVDDRAVESPELALRRLPGIDRHWEPGVSILLLPLLVEGRQVVRVPGVQ